MNPQWKNMGNAITEVKKIRDNYILGNASKGVPVYFRTLDKDTYKEISWNGLQCGQFTIHMVWGTDKAQIIDNCLYPGKIWDQVKYFKNLYNITKSSNKKLIIQTQVFPINTNLEHTPRFEPTSIFYI